MFVISHDPHIFHNILLSANQKRSTIHPSSSCSSLCFALFCCSVGPFSASLFSASLFSASLILLLCFHVVRTASLTSSSVVLSFCRLQESQSQDGVPLRLRLCFAAAVDCTTPSKRERKEESRHKYQRQQCSRIVVLTQHGSKFTQAHRTLSIDLTNYYHHH